MNAYNRTVEQQGGYLCLSRLVLEAAAQEVGEEESNNISFIYFLLLSYSLTPLESHRPLC